jgi:hypothetical protein
MHFYLSIAARSLTKQTMETVTQAIEKKRAMPHGIV